MSAAGPPLDPAAQAAAKAAMDQFITEAWTLLAVGISVTILRAYARIRSVSLRGLQADDYLVWIGVTVYIAEISLAYSIVTVTKGLANNGMTDEQRATLSPDSDEYRLRVIGSKIQVSAWSSYSTILWALKASLLVFYLRLTAGLGRAYRIRIYIGFAFLLASWITVIMNIFLACRPFHKNWQINPNPGAVCQPATSPQLVWVCFSMNVTTDLYLISIPVPMLWRSSLKTLKKAGLIILFSGGLIVVACATLRCALVISDPVNGTQLAGSWAVRETFIALVTTNLPVVFPIVKLWITPVVGSLLSFARSSGHGSQKLSNKPSKGTFGSNQIWRRRGGPPTENPITEFTFSESEERIVGNGIKLQDMPTTWSQPASTSDSSTDRHNKNNGIGGGGSYRNSIQKQVQVSVTVTDNPESGYGEGGAGNTTTRHDGQPPTPGEHGTHTFARGPNRLSIFHFGNRD